MGLSTLPTKTDASLGREKVDKPARFPLTPDLRYDVPAAEHERIKQAIIDIAGTIGLSDGTTAGSLEERVAVLEASSGGGGSLQTSYGIGSTISVVAAKGPVALSNNTDTTHLLTLTRLFAGVGDALRIQMAIDATGAPVRVIDELATDRFSIDREGNVSVGSPASVAATKQQRLSIFRSDAFFLDSEVPADAGTLYTIDEYGLGRSNLWYHDGLNGAVRLVDQGRIAATLDLLYEFDPNISGTAPLQVTIASGANPAFRAIVPAGGTTAFHTRFADSSAEATLAPNLLTFGTSTLGSSGTIQTAARTTAGGNSGDLTVRTGNVAANGAGAPGNPGNVVLQGGSGNTGTTNDPESGAAFSFGGDIIANAGADGGGTRGGGIVHVGQATTSEVRVGAAANGIGLRLFERATVPAIVANSGALYAADVGGFTELRYADHAGTVHQLSTPIVESHTGATRTLAPSDHGKIIMQSSTPCTYTVPSSGLKAGWTVTLVQIGSAAITVDDDGGTVNVLPPADRLVPAQTGQNGAFISVTVLNPGVLARVYGDLVTA